MESFKMWVVLSCVILVFTNKLVEAAEEETCYGGGSIAGAVFGTLFATLALIGLGYLIYRYYWKTRKDKHLVLMSDPENVKDEFAFDNPGFKDGAPPPAGAATNNAGGGSGWLRTQAPPTLAPAHDKQPNSQQKSANGGGQQNADKRKNGESVGARVPMTQNQGKGFLDDTFAEKRREATVVPLWSRDFTGLGFEVCGNMRDGIFVSSVLRGGPAYESGRIHIGDRINSVSISTRHMVYEDALAILSHASPYEIHLEVEQQQSGNHLGTGGLNHQSPTGLPGVTGGTLDRRSTAGQMNQSGAVVHPIAAKAVGRMRAGSYGDINTLEKASRQSHFPRQSPNSTLDTSSQSKNNTSAGSAIKKMITDKINITSGASLERNNKTNNHMTGQNQTTTTVANTTTLERENEKNTKNHGHKSHYGKTTMDHTAVNYDSDLSNKEDNLKAERNNRNKHQDRSSAPPDVVIIKDGGDRYSAKVEKVDLQKKEAESGKKGMKFGIRVLPPNVPDDGTLSNRNSKVDIGKGMGENGNIVAEIRSIDEVDKNFESVTVSPGKESTKPKAPIPVVAKRREKPAAPIPNARNLPQNISSGSTNVSMTVVETTKIDPIISGKNEVKMDIDVSGFDRGDDLNSSGIKRDSQGIPQEIPQHMMEAAMYARSNRKASSDYVSGDKQKTEYVPSKYSDSKKAEKFDKESSRNKKSKGKAPSPPEGSSRSRDDNDNSSDTDVSSVTQETMIGVEISKDRKGLNFTDNFNDQTFLEPHAFIEAEREHTARLQETNRTDDMILGKTLISSTPKIDKVVKRMRPDVPTQKAVDIPDDFDNYGLKPFHRKEASESMNNLYEDSKSNISSNIDGSSMMSQDSFASNVMSELDKIGNISTTIELNSSDITIHSSPVTESEERHVEDSDDNERKAASLGDLSKLEPADKNSRKPSQGTLERAQSLDISAEDAKIVASEKHITPKKRKSNSVFDGSYYDNVADDLPTDSNESVNQLMGHSKEPRLSLNISNISSMEGLNTFQRNRLKKASEWGNMEDALMMKKNIADSSNSGSSEIANSAENLNEMSDAVAKALEDENAKLNNEINKLKFVSNEIVGEAIDKAVHKTTELNNYKNLSANVTVTKPVVDYSIGDIRIETGSQVKPEISSNSTIDIHNKTTFVKPEVPTRIKTSDINEQVRPNFEIGTYVSDTSGAKYKTETPTFSSSRHSPKLEDKLTMIYDTNIPDDIKVSRHSLVSSLERPKSDLMKKLLAQNPTLNVGVESHTDLKKDTDKVVIDKSVVGENLEITSATNIASPDLCNDKGFDSKANATTFTLLNQPDIVNLRIKQHNAESKTSLPSSSGTVVSGEEDTGMPGNKNESDFVSNINIVGTTSKGEASKMNFQFDTASAPDKVQTRNFFSTNDNVVTISTDGSQPSSIITIEGEAPVVPNVVESFRNSIEINRHDNFTPKDTATSQSEQSLYNEIISELQKPKPENESHSTSNSTTTSTRTYLVDGGVVTEERIMAPYIVDSQTVNLPPQKTVTVNVTYDEHGNKIVTQNVEETTTRLVTIKSSLPIEIEEYTFGVIKNPTAADIQRIEDSEMGTGVDMKLLSDIERQNPNIRFTSNDPMYSNTDTMVVNANMTEEETRALLAKLKDNPQMFMDGNRIMNQKSTVIRETEMILDNGNDNFDGHPIIKMSQSSYKFNIEDAVQNSPAKIVKMIENDTRKTIEHFDTTYNNSNSSENLNKLTGRISNKSNGGSESVYMKSDSLSSDRRDSARQESDPIFKKMEIKHDTAPAKDFITEIEVLTPRSEKISKQKSDLEKSKQYYSDKMSTYYSEPNLSNEIDFSLMGDFLNCERRFSAKERIDSEKYERSKSSSPDSVQNGKESRRQSNEDESKSKRHSDFDLPRNTHIKFRTATYEPLTAPPSRLSSSEKRLSQIEILKSNFEKGGSSENLSNISPQNNVSSVKPAVSMKPSSIPIKLPEIKMNAQMKTPTISPSKIPVLNSGKSASQENLLDGSKGLGIQKTSPHGKLSSSTGNISVTSIKSSSRNPSGK